MQEFLKEIIKEAGALGKKYYLAGVKQDYKSDPTDIVTVADHEVNDFLIGKIRARFPDHGIISEEEKEEINPGAEYIWVMDPIDGTRNFANHIAVWCTMVGVLKNGRPWLGAIYDAMNDELYFAEIGKGAFLNGEKIGVSAVEDIKSFSIAFSAGQRRGNSPYNAAKLEKYVKFLDNILADDGHWITNLGTMLSICHLSAGRMDSVVLNCGLLHDYLPGFIIATEAGAKWTNSDGKEWKFGEMDIIVANPALHAKLMKLF